MSYETETLKLLRKSLDEEEDETSIISVLEHHHKYLREYISILTTQDIDSEHKQATLALFITIFNMYAKAEQDTFYRLLKEATNRDVRLESLKAFDENEIAFEIIKELRDLNATESWSEEIDAKVRVLAGLVKGHLKEEDTILYPMAEKFIPESRLIDLTDEYLEKCKTYLSLEMESSESAVSGNGAMTFFY